MLHHRLILSFIWIALVFSSAGATKSLHANIVQASNGTIFILGDLLPVNDSQLVMRHVAASIEVAVIGHTVHWHPQLDTPVTVFGLQSSNNDYMPPLSTWLFRSELKPTSQPPVNRYNHASVATNDVIYVLGGQTLEAKSPLSDVWQYSFVDNRWTHIYDLSRGITGHSSILYQHWLLPCFGSQGDRGCRVCFDVMQRKETVCENDGEALPEARTQTSIIRLRGMNSHLALVYGGLTTNGEILDDLWILDLSQIPRLQWTRISLPSGLSGRAGHTAVLVNDSTVLFYGGSTTNGVKTDPAMLLFDLDRFAIGRKRSRLFAREPAETVSNEDKQRDHGLRGGAIAGIVVGVLAFVGMSVGFVVWTRHQQRQQRLHFHRGSRVARFSLSTPPPSRPTSNMAQTGAEDSLGNNNSVQATAAARLSALSFGSDFAVSTSDACLGFPAISIEGSSSDDTHVKRQSVVDFVPPQYPEPSRQKSRLGSSSLSSLPQKKAVVVDNNNNNNSSTESIDPPPPTTAQSSSSFKRLTLNLGGSTVAPTLESNTDPFPQPSESSSGAFFKRYSISAASENEKKKRRSSLFGLRASRLLRIPGANNNAQEHTMQPPVSRLSVASSAGARSVASVQWVGFNDAMDYKEHHWNPTVRLAVTNQFRQSTATTEDDDDRSSFYGSMKAAGLQYHRHNGSLPSNSPAFRF